MNSNTSVFAFYSIIYLMKVFVAKRKKVLYCFDIRDIKTTIKGPFEIKKYLLYEIC